MIELSNITSPEDIRQLTIDECESLADDIRTKIIQTVSVNGGHLASNLGIVEITMALHRVFHAPEDKLIFDVGHQTYTHKLLTGRFSTFDTLRTYGGISGFPRHNESEYDCFEAGHASTALSAALGFARARDALKQKHHVVAVVGDGALTGGMCYEALNDCGNSRTRMIVLLNDNEMSIAENVGALSRYLSRLRSSTGWIVTKKQVKHRLQNLPLIGKGLYNIIHSGKEMIKSLVVDDGFFSALGFRYLGPINGNDLSEVERMLTLAKEMDEPVLIHCLTKKGYGYMSAEKKPEEFHGTPPFLIESGKSANSSAKSNGAIANEELIKLADTDERIRVITAAMPLGTGTAAFAKAHPDQFDDVGIAEEHAVTLCAGMASGGLKPFFFVYSTFLQRGYDQVLHDVCIQNLPVTFMIDRAGISNEDGQSHQGLFDMAFLRHIPGLTLIAPADEQELRLAVKAAYEWNAPCAIRYPKSAVVLPDGASVDTFAIGKWETLVEGTEATILSVGSMTAAAMRVAAQLNENGLSVQVVNASTIKPLDTACLDKLFAEGKPVFTLEEHVVAGGFGSAVLEYAALSSANAQIIPIGVADCFVQHGDHQHLLEDVELDDNTLVKRVLHAMTKEDRSNG
ncbi:MAG: 1-deoxy-D-xylulose-5-phosphate synthase [Clostridiales bacterium]|nr:1-deoxy-D-xylulose-5-phosphate synthase [Clostridiales bacterium]